MKKRLTLKMGKKERGFTLIELLIVIAILGVLAAVVVPNVMGLFGRGGSQAYGSDAQTIQTSVATFYGDVHTGPGTNGGAAAWGCNNTTAGHWFPTSTGRTSTIVEGSALGLDVDNPDNYQLLITTGGAAVNTSNITAAAVWMGLLVNPAEASANTTDRGDATPVIFSNGVEEESMYLTEFPKSCTAGDTGNGNEVGTGGTYTWIVGANGKLFGAYQASDGNWYNGFAGNYP